MIGFKQKRLVRKALRLALKPVPGIDYGKHTWSTKIYNRLTTLAIYSVVDKTTVPITAMTCLRCFSQGWNYEQIAEYTRLSVGTVEHKIIEALDFIIDHTPEDLIQRIPVVPRRYRGGACLKCRGTLAWETEEGEYHCINCGAPHDTQGRMISRRV